MTVTSFFSPATSSASVDLKKAPDSQSAYEGRDILELCKKKRPSRYVSVHCLSKAASAGDFETAPFPSCTDRLSDSLERAPPPTLGNVASAAAAAWQQGTQFTCFTALDIKCKHMSFLSGKKTLILLDLLAQKYLPRPSISDLAASEFREKRRVLALDACGPP